MLKILKMFKLPTNILLYNPLFENSDWINDTWIINNPKLVSFNYLTYYFIENDKLVIDKNRDMFFKYIDLFNWEVLSYYITFENYNQLKDFQCYFIFTQIRDPILKEVLKVMINLEQTRMQVLQKNTILYPNYHISYLYVNYYNYNIQYIFDNRNIINFHYLALYGYNIINYIYAKCNDEHSINLGRELLNYFSIAELIKNKYIQTLLINNNYYLVNTNFLLSIN